ncbi:hypothetical protein, partial [Sutterella wadsworthensis]|uniref:hypothetical protein n=1 Tax=Sutterella wadsworthensis TaxID=40545 RepID=UPI0026DC76EF
KDIDGTALVLVSRHPVVQGSNRLTQLFLNSSSLGSLGSADRESPLFLWFSRPQGHGMEGEQ